MFNLVLLTALAQPAPAVSAAQPVQVLARVDARGNLTITSVIPCGSGMAAPAMPPRDSAPPPKDAAKEPVKVKVTTVVVTTIELPARAVEAYTTDGRTVPADKLAELLAKDRPVLVALDGKKVDPFLLQLYKEGTILLVPPANTIPLGHGASAGPVRIGGSSDAPPPPVVPEAIPDRPRKP